MKRIVQFIQNHTLILLYSVVFIFLVLGVYIESGTTYLSSLAVYGLTLYASYLALNLTLRRRLSFLSTINLPVHEEHLSLIIKGSSLLVVVYIISHYLFLENIPAITALLSTDYLEIVQIRKSITSHNVTFIKYATSLLNKAIMPFLLVIFFHRKQYGWFLVLCVIFSCYSVTLIQKSYILSVLAPVIAFAFLSKKWKTFLTFTLIVIFSWCALFLITNPPSRIGADNKTKQEATQSGNISFKEGQTNRSTTEVLLERIFLIPGWVVSKWFENIPAKHPFANGNGYRFVALIKGEKFVRFPTELYKEVFPIHYSKGVRGSINAAHFMYDYGNFGTGGLVLSGVLLALLLLFIEVLFQDFFMFKFSLNMFSVLMLSSTALTTILASGGWVLTIAMFLFFKPLLHEPQHQVGRIYS